MNKVFTKDVVNNVDTCPKGLRLSNPFWRLFSISEPRISGSVLLKVDNIVCSNSIISAVKFWCPTKDLFTFSQLSLILKGTGVTHRWDEFQSHFNILLVANTVTWSPNQETVCCKFNTSVANWESKSCCCCYNKWASLCHSLTKSVVCMPWCKARPATVAVAVTEATVRNDAMMMPSILRDRWRRVCTAFTRGGTAKEPDHVRVRFPGNQSPARAFTVTEEWLLEWTILSSTFSHQERFIRWVKLQSEHFEISCLSVASFAIIFSHSEGYLFTLLIFSFVVQKAFNFN